MFCWSRSLFILVVIMLGSSSMMSACGQKGPLILPDNSSQTTASTESSTKK